MRLVTKLTDTRSRIDTLVNIEYSVGSNILTCHFKTSTKMGEEEFGESFDLTTPVIVPITEIKEALDIVVNKCLEKRTQQINKPSSISLEPDYKGFYNAILISETFGVVQNLTTINSSMNLAYTTFGFALTVSMAGHVNKEGMQTAFNNITTLLPQLAPLKSKKLIDELKALITLYRIPLVVS